MADADFTAVTNQAADSLPEWGTPVYGEMNLDEFAETLFAKLEGEQPKLSCDDMDKLEQWWRDDMRNRRCALVMLTMPFADFRQKVEGDRDFAKAVADTLSHVQGAIDGCQAAVDFLGCSQAWMMAALACREDMSEILAEQKLS